MSTPRLEIRLDRIADNARTLAGRLGTRGITVCGVTKATLGSAEVAHELVAAGVTSLGESRVENVERLRRAGITAEIMLIRSPMMSQAERVVACADVSLNTELDIINELSRSAQRQRRRHGVVVMVELGDIREGVMPGDLPDTVRRVLDFPGIWLRGIGTNLACQSGVIPDASNMAELSDLANSIETAFGLRLDIVSGGNSANLDWALDPASDIGRINHLRLGESILLGREPIRRSALAGLHTDTMSIVGEVIESKRKPSHPRGERGETAFGDIVESRDARDGNRRIIVALGRQDTDAQGLVAPRGYAILGASSDHLILLAPADAPAVGAELRFEPNYSALLGAMTSPFVTRQYLGASLSGRGQRRRADALSRVGAA